jgi:hypothetical protein
MDNKPIKDGVGNVFTVRMRDISVGQDGSLQRSLIYATSYPVDYGAGGCYQHCAKSGLITAGLPIGSTIYSCRWTDNTRLPLIRRVRLSAATLSAGFAAGVATFDIYAVRGFTAPDSGGAHADLTGNHAMLRSGPMGVSTMDIHWGVTGAVTPGTRTPDADPLDSVTVVAPTGVNTPFASAVPLFAKQQGEHPLALAPNEGFIILASVPATGAWQFSVTTEWDETSVNF